MLDSDTIKKINDFVYQKPRTIQEISLLIKKNWRTADRYISKISKETGSLNIRTFREGTPGALKIVFWNTIEKIHSSEFQERLFKQIEAGRSKKDFSPLDIYSYIEKGKQAITIDNYYEDTPTNYDNFVKELKNAESQILLFSGNLSFIHMKKGNESVLDVLEKLAKNNVNIKILTRIELPGLKNILDVLSINDKLGKKLIEIRHCYQPLRCMIIDNKIANLRENKYKEDYEEGELKKDMVLLLKIYDEEWILWLQKVFWNLFRRSIGAEKKLKDLETIKKL